MQLRIRNLGPVKSCDVELLPLNVFVGPNNAGKSMVAQLLYAVTAAAPTGYAMASPTMRVLRSSSGVRVGGTFFGGRQGEELVAALADLEQTLADSDGPPKALPPLLAEVMESVVKRTIEAYVSSLLAGIERTFGAPPDDLVRTKNGRRMPASLVISHGEPEWRAEIRFNRPKPVVDIDLSFSGADVIERVLASESARRIQVRLRQGVYQEPFPELLRLGIAAVFQEFPFSSYYLPAARSGILQSHRLLAAAVIQGANFAGLREMRVPKMSGVVSDFVGQLLTLTDFESDRFQEAAQHLESQVLEGLVTVDTAMEQYPTISYVMDDHEYALHRTSSMVSELAPIVLYLRHVVSPGDLLIVEEPEAHLHPESQVRLGRVLAELVDQGLTLAVTTHSDFFLQQINNSIRTASVDHPASDLPPPVRASNVGAYLFERAPDHEGTTVLSLKVSSMEGISDAEFARVTESLYLESLQLDRRLGPMESTSEVVEWE